jgi:hypothetical protein
MNNNNLLVKAAVAGILGAAALGFSSSAQAKGKAAAKDAGVMGHCMHANSCKGKSACKTEGNECAGKNGCKGKGFTEATEANCNALKAKDPAVAFVAPAK